MPKPVDRLERNDGAVPAEVATSSEQLGNRQSDAAHLDPSDRDDARAQPKRSSDALGLRLTALPDGHPSSPRDENGRTRPSAVRLRDLELSADAADAEKPDRPSRDRIAASDSWQAVKPSLERLWEQHEERWPATERPVADRSKDEPGSWRSDAGHYLSPAENLAAGQVFAKARDAEPYVTRDLLAIEADTPQARMEGLEFRLKEENRCKEKLAHEFREKPGRTVEQVSQAAGRMPDTLRYTYTFCAQDYAAGQQAVLAKLEERGYELVLSRNSWDNPQYKGLNTRWGTASGQVFEVQFHTPDSFDGKQLTHNAYERLRLDPDTEEEGPELREYQRVVTSYIAVPEGAATIPDYRREGY